MDIEKQSTPETKERPMWQFHVVRILSYACVAFLYALVSFQKQCQSTVAEAMAKTYGVPISELGIFASVYFYPYAATQPFAGLLADIMDPAYVVGIAQLVVAIGSIICGLSKSLGVGIFGRLLVGLGCGPTYVSVCRIITNWFKLSQLPLMLGILVSCAGAGGILAAGPTAKFLKSYDWPIAFYGIGGIGIFFSIITLIFIRGNPVSKGFKPVNEELASTNTQIPIKQKLVTLWINFKTVVSYGYFWLIACFNIFSSGPYFDTAGLWGGPYLVQILGYSKEKKGNTLISYSIGLIIGSLSLPSISTALKTRKWVMVFSSALVFFVMLSFTIAGDKMPDAAIWVLNILIGAFTNPLTSVAYPLVREYFHPSVSGTSVGCSNIFTFLASAVFQQVSSALIPLGGKKHISEHEVEYTWKGFKNGLWLFCTVSLAVSTLAAALTKDSDFSKPKQPTESKPEETKKEDKHEEEEEAHAPSDEMLDEL